MSNQTDSSSQSALAPEVAQQPRGPGPNAQVPAQGAPQPASDTAHNGAQQPFQPHQSNHQYGQRSRDYHVRRNSHSRGGSGPGGPGQANNSYRSRGGGQGGHRYGGAHSRGNSYHQSAMSPQNAFQGHQAHGSIPMYSGAATAMPPYYSYAPNVYPGPPGSPGSQAPIFYPPFQIPAGSPMSRSRVAISDASGNPIDLAATVARNHHHVGERAPSEPQQSHSRSSSVAGTPDAAEAEVTVKKATSNSSVVENMKAMIAARKKAKAEADAAAQQATASTQPQLAAEAAPAQAEITPTPAPQEQKSETVAETKPEEQPEAKNAVQSEIKAAPATEPKPEEGKVEAAPSGPVDGAAGVPEPDTKAAPASKSPAGETETAKAQAHTAEEPIPESKPESQSSGAPKKAAWKAPSVVRLEAAKAAAAAAAASADDKETEPSEAAPEPVTVEPKAEKTPLATTTEEDAVPDEPLKDDESKDATPTPQEEKVDVKDDGESGESRESEETPESSEKRVQAFSERMSTATRPTPEELDAHTYPSSIIPNGSFGSGNRYLYTPEFLQQFETIVPRLNHSNVRTIVGFDYELTTTGGGGRWGSGMGPRSMSSRGPSRVGSFANFGRGLSRNASGAQSMRGRQGSRRRGDRQGSRRDRDDVTANGTPIADLPPLKKAENAWTPRFRQQKDDSVTDDGRLTPEEVQRKIKSLLNKMAWENFERISTEIREVALQSEKETTAITLRQIIQLTFEKAIDEPHWSGMYAQLFWFLHVDQPLPDTIEDHSDPDKVIKGVYVLRRYLLNMSQKEFEKGWASIVETSSGAAVLSDEYYAALAQKRRGLGLIQFVGELYKLSLISDRLLTSCFRRLMNEEPSEDIVESTSRLLKTVAPIILQKNGKQLLDMVMETMKSWRESGKLAARLRFMIMDVEDLARKNWEGIGQDGPKTIAQVHEDAVKREQAEQRERARRGTPGGRRGDFGRPFAGGKRR